MEKWRALHMEKGDRRRNFIRRFLKGFVLLLLAGLFVTGCHRTEEGDGTSSENAMAQKTKGPVTVAAADLQDYVARFVSLGTNQSVELQRLKAGKDCYYVRKYDYDWQAYQIAKVSLIDDREELVIRLNGNEGEAAEIRSALCFDSLEDGRLVVFQGVYSQKDGGELAGPTDDEFAEPSEGESTKLSESEFADLQGGESTELPEGEFTELTGFELAEYDASGKQIACRRLEGDLGIDQTNTYFMKMSVDGDGNIVLIANEVILISADGSRVSRPVMEQEELTGSLVRTKEGEIWILLSTSQGTVVKKADFRQGTLEVVEGLPEHVSGLGQIMQSDINGDVLICEQDNVYLYDGTERVLTPLTLWSKNGVNGTGLFSICMTGENLLAANMEGEVAILRPRKADEPERVTLLLATLWNHGDLPQIVSYFNRSQTEYQVTVVEYAKDAQSSLEWQEPYERMMMDVLGENPPDLIDVGGALSVRLQPSLADLLEKDYVEDLNPYLTQSTKLQRDQLEEKVLAFCTSQGKLGAIPTSFGITTLTVNGQEFPNRFGWSTDEMKAYDQKHPQTELMEKCSAQMIFELTITRNMGSFVDFENAKADFQSPQFKALMEYAATYPDGDSIVYNNAKEKLVNLRSIYSPVSIQKIRNLDFAGHGQLIGYPTLDGTPLSLLNVGLDCGSLSICKRSTAKEGAWKFIEYTLEYDYLEKENYMSTFAGIPTNKVLLKKMLEVLSAKGGPLDGLAYQDGLGGKYKSYPLTEEEEELLYQLIDSATFDDPRLREVAAIVREEAAPYFAGQKSLDQVIDVMENRVRLYLQENQ